MRLSRLADFAVVLMTHVAQHQEQIHTAVEVDRPQADIPRTPRVAPRRRVRERSIPYFDPIPLDDLVPKLIATPYYAPLYQAAFGSSTITSDRTARALAQYVRSLVSTGSKYDRAFTATGTPTPTATPTYPGVLLTFTPSPTS